jgi:antitoxin HigA-1
MRQRMRAATVEHPSLRDGAMKTTSGRPAIHPGEFLAEILIELGISQAAFARAVGVSPMRVSHVIKGVRPVSAELALKFGKIFGQSPKYWMNLQAAYDLATARKLEKLIAEITKENRHPETDWGTPVGNEI